MVRGRRCGKPNEPAARIHMTPDEQELIYDTGRPRNIWKLHIKGTQAKQLTFERERAWFPEISWDGKWIVYQVGRGDSSQIAVMDINGGQQEILTPEPGKRFSHSFASTTGASPTRDSRRACGTSTGSTGSRWSANRLRTIPPTVRSCGVPAWRPGTEQMAYEYSEVKGNIELLPLGSGR